MAQNIFERPQSAHSPALGLYYFEWYVSYIRLYACVESEQ